MDQQSKPILKSFFAFAPTVRIISFINYCLSLHCFTFKEALDRSRIYIPERAVGIHYYQRGGQLLPVVVFKSCNNVSDLCHEIAVIWLLWTFAFDDLVIRCHYRMVCINLRQHSSLGDLFHQNLSLCWPTDRKPGIWSPVWTTLYSITILRSVLYGEIVWGVCKVIMCFVSMTFSHLLYVSSREIVLLSMYLWTTKLE